MSKTKLNILTPIPFWHPGTQELIDGLNKNSYEVVVLDIWSYNYIDKKGNIHNLVPKLFKNTFERIYKRIFRKRIIKKYISKDQIVDLQWCGHYYSKYIKTIKDCCINIISSPFGSDVLRATPEQHKLQKSIFNASKIIVLSKNWASEFLDIFPECKEKLSYNQFGSKRFDIIASMFSTEKKYELKSKYNIPLDRIVVAVGYSANPFQQHNLFLNKLENTKSAIKDKIFLLFPLTYGISKQDTYYLSLITKIKSLKIPYLLFEDRLTDVELCETRIISDIMITTQKTDTQASSIKEAFAAHNVVIAGDWLPYSLYSRMGLNLILTKKEDIDKTFIDVLLNYHTFNTSPDSLEKLRTIASWESIVNEFIKTYENVKS